MALGCQIVDLVRLHLLDYPDQIFSVCQVAVVQDEVSVFSVWILVQVVHTVSVEA